MSTREDKSRGGLLKSMLAVFGFRRTRKATDFAEEIQAHIALETEALRADGRTEREAQTLAKRTFGNVTQAEEAFYESSRWLWLDHFVQDLRYALRGLWKSPAFSLAAGTTLALAIGANTAIFSVVDAVLLRPLPFKDSDKLVVVTERNVRAHVDQTGVPYPSFREWATENHTFEEMAAYWNVKGDGVVLGGIASAERIRFSIVTENFFSILGIAPAAGREFLAPEQEPGNGHVFLASDALWRRSLGGKPDAIGKSFLLDGQSFTLIGVLPAGLRRTAISGFRAVFSHWAS